MSSTMTRYLPAVCLSAALLSSAALAASPDSKAEADLIAKAGGAAAGFAAVSAGPVTPEQVRAHFAGLGDKAVETALQWAQDEELRDAPPAFRRFLYFDYFTKGTDIIAAASNPPELLINTDAAVDYVFEDAAVAAAARAQMAAVIEQPTYHRVCGQQLAAYPMMPAQAKAAKCIECHASTEVGRPYPEGAKVLGYTFVAIPQ